MGQWESQTRKLNNHYQSVRHGTPLEQMRASLPLAFHGTRFKNGSFAFFPPRMWEPGTSFSDVKLSSVLDPVSVGGLLWSPSGDFICYKWATSNGEHEIYAGYYDTPAEYDLNHGPGTLSETAAAVTLNVTSYTLSGSTISEAGTYTTTPAEENGQKALIPHMKRWCILYKVMDAGADPGDIWADATDEGTLSTVSTDLIATGAPSLTDGITLIQSILPEEAQAPPVRVQGSQLIRITNTADPPDGNIAGCDARGRNSTDTTVTDADFSNRVYSSSTTPRLYSSGRLASFPGVCLGTYREQGGVPYCITLNAHSSRCNFYSVIASGGNYLGYHPAISGGYYFRPYSLINGTYYIFWRKILSFSVVDNYTFWNISES